MKNGTIHTSTLFTFSFLFLVVMAAGAASLSIDCAAEGAFTDNFSSWSDGMATTSVVQDDGARFLRIESDATKGTVQYRLGRVDGDFPGFYRLRVRSRNRGSGFTVLLRQDEPPYKALATAILSAPDWTLHERYLDAKASKIPVGLYVQLGSGSYDFASVCVEAVRREDLVASYRRPPKDADEIFFPTRFPLGLPQGWIIGRESYRTTAEAKDGNLVIRSNGEKAEVCSAPFQTCCPDQIHFVYIVYRAKGGKWKFALYDDKYKQCGDSKKLPDTDAFVRVRERMWIPGLTSSVTLCFSGTGELELKEVHIVPEGRKAGSDKPTAALRFRGGEVGDRTRIVFADEKPSFEWKVVAAPEGARARFSLTDVYGRTKPVGEEPVTAAGGVVTDLDLPTLGAYRLRLDVFGKDGATLAATECVFCRLQRPVGWGRDLPDSPFGIHMMPREDHVRLAKACGINWTRLHDAGTECTGWWALEAEKGCWTFHDDLVDVYRRNGVKILAQLGTSPAWASHFHDLGYKSMWYFARYLRPTNTTDYVNYVTKTVSHYRGKIDEYFFWNEPWSGWWTTAADMKYFDKNRAAEDYAAFQKLTYDAVKAVDPAIRFVGLNSNAFDTGWKWSERVAAAGGLAACDIVDYHYYTGSLRATRTDANTVRKAFRTLYDTHPNLDGRPVYMTEGSGHNDGSIVRPDHVSGLYSILVPWTPETTAEWTARAGNTVRFALSMLADGNRRIFLFSTSCHMALGVMPPYAILVAADGGPSPECAAFSQFARAVEGLRFVSGEPYGERGMVYAFGRRTPGANAVPVRIYTDLTQAEVIELSGRGRCLDLYGNPMVVRPSADNPGGALGLDVVYSLVGR